MSAIVGPGVGRVYLRGSESLGQLVQRAIRDEVQQASSSQMEMLADLMMSAKYKQAGIVDDITPGVRKLIKDKKDPKSSSKPAKVAAKAKPAPDGKKKRTMSPEARAAMSAGMRRHWARRKAKTKKSDEKPKKK